MTKVVWTRYYEILLGSANHWGKNATVYVVKSLVLGLLSRRRPYLLLVILELMRIPGKKM